MSQLDPMYQPSASDLAGGSTQLSDMQVDTQSVLNEAMNTGQTASQTAQSNAWMAGLKEDLVTGSLAPHPGLGPRYGTQFDLYPTEASTAILQRSSLNQVELPAGVSLPSREASVYGPALWTVEELAEGLKVAVGDRILYRNLIKK